MNIIACDSTTFKKGKSSYSPFEAELTAVHWALTRKDYFCRGARKILVCSDVKSMAGFLAQDLDKIANERNQKMVEEIMHYNVEVRYVPGPKMEFADYGSLTHNLATWESVFALGGSNLSTSRILR